MKLRSLPLVVVLFTAALFAACGSSGKPGTFTQPPGGDDSGVAVGPDGSVTYPDGGVILPPPGDGSTIIGPLVIMPMDPVVQVVTGMPAPTVQFTATVGGAATGVAWGLDRGELGTISSAGVFTPSGNVGGVGHVTANYGSQNATTTITVNIQTTDLGDPGRTTLPDGGPLDAGAGGYGGVGGNGPGAPPDGGQTGTLNGTPAPDATVSLLYPYDGTVWPQGLLAPLLQWQPGAHDFDSVYVHITEKNYEYKGYFSRNAVPFVNVPIPQAAWTAMAYSNGGEPVTVSLVFGEGANAIGPYTETWTIAQATLQGTIYYNSYGTQLVKNSATDGLDSYGNQYGAGTLAITTGATAPTLVAGVNSVAQGGDGTGCRVCHTVSANGQALVTQAGSLHATPYDRTVYVNLSNDTTGGAGSDAGTNLAFPALYKDGSLLLSSSGGMINGDNSTQLYSLPGGAKLAATGLPNQAALPAFSPDGTLVSFNYWSGSYPSPDGGANLNGDAHSLAVLDFDGHTTFSNPRLLYTPQGGHPVSYSSFYPNSAGIVFEVELGGSGGFGFTWHDNLGELWWVDVASAQAHRLDALNGYGAAGAVYLPSGGAHTGAEDATLNYEASVNPIASGGYAWVVFTSRRMYGNVAQLGPWQSDPRNYPWLEQVTDKKLWVAAVDLNGKPGTDPSHPAFYLPAQELHAGNARGYWTVDACRPDGASCTAGDMCCGGFCQPGPDAGLICTSQMPMCAGEFEKCTQTSDCCGAAQGQQCINGICTVSAPR